MTTISKKLANNEELSYKEKKYVDKKARKNEIRRARNKKLAQRNLAAGQQPLKL